MNLFGIGNLEIVFVLVIMLLVLGPSRMVDVARSLARYWSEAQRTLRSFADAATIALDEPPSLNRLPRDPVPAPEDAVARSSDDDGDGAGGADGGLDDGAAPGDEGQVERA
jgi:Sec-independent protein translocase protein TatA